MNTRIKQSLIFIFSISLIVGGVLAAIPNNTLRNNWLVITGVNVTGSYQIDGNDIITGAGIADFTSVDADQYSLATVNVTDILAYPQIPTSFVIFTDGTNIYAKNGTTGNIDFSGTDAYTVIQNAIDAIDTRTGQGGKLFFKNGRYLLHRELNVTAGMDYGYVFEGEVAGWDYAEPMGAVLVADPVGYVGDFVLQTDINWFWLINMGIDGGGTGAAGSGKNGVYLDNWDSHVINCNIAYCNWGIQGNRNQWISNCWIEYCGTYDIWLGLGAYVWITDNMFYDTAATSHIYVRGVAAGSEEKIVWIKGNRFNDAAQAVQVYGDVKNIILEGNFYYQITNYCVQVISGGIARNINVMGDIVQGLGDTDGYLKVEVGGQVDYFSYIGGNIQSLSTTNVFNNAGTLTKSVLSKINGYITENSGTATILNATTSIYIPHGCSYTPTAKDVSYVFTENPTNAITYQYVGNLTSTGFTIYTNDPGATNLDLSWQVRKTP